MRKTTTNTDEAFPRGPAPSVACGTRSPRSPQPSLPDTFSNAELDRLLAALPPAADVPAGKKLVIGADGDQSGQTIYAGFRRTPDHPDGVSWELQAWDRIDRTSGNSYGTRIVLDWPVR